MCRAFSAIVTRNKKVYWKIGMDSHNGLISHFKLKDEIKGKIIPIEIVPKDYLNMAKPTPTNKDWEFKFDDGCPDWWKQSHETASWNACKEWYKEIIKLVNFKEARNPIHPFKIKAKKVTKVEIKLLKDWVSVRDSVWGSAGDSVGDSVWDSVRASAGDSVGDSVWGSVWGSAGDSVWGSVRDSVWGSVWGSVRDSVWDSMGASVGSMFKITKWKYTEKIKIKGYPFQSVVELWKKGFVPSFDGTDWRLHAGKKAKVVYKISKKELLKFGGK